MGNQIPKPKVVFDDPDAHLDFLTAATDTDFEGQHFDRKEACRPGADGNVPKSALRNLDSQIAECISAFCNTNRNGGLLVLGIGSTGQVYGVDHLNEEQLNAATRLSATTLSRIRKKALSTRHGRACCRITS
jgi:hypothetical protein